MDHDGIRDLWPKYQTPVLNCMIAETWLYRLVYTCTLKQVHIFAYN